MSDFSRFSNNEKSYGFIFWQTYTLWQRKIKKELKFFKLTHTQFVILSVISYLELSSEKISQTDVSVLSKIDVMTISSCVKILIKNGYVISTSNPNDSRANVLSLTTEGKEVQHKAMFVIEHIDKGFFEIEGIDLDVFLFSLLKIRDENQEDEA